MLQLPYELQLYIYEFDDNQHYKSLFNKCLVMISNYNYILNVVSYFAHMYHYHNIHYVNCTSSIPQKTPLTCSQYILYHSKRYGHLMIYKYIKPSHIRYFSP